MTTTTENQPAKAKQKPAFYIFDNAAVGKGGKPAGAVFPHGKGKGFTILIGGKRYAAFPPKTKAEADTVTQPEGDGA